MADDARRRVVVQAYLLIQTEVGRAGEVAAALRRVPGVVRVDPVTGPYDVVALGEATDAGALESHTVDAVGRVAGITRTLICSVVNL